MTEKEKEQTNIEKLRDIMFQDDDLEVFLKDYSGKFRISDALRDVMEKRRIGNYYNSLFFFLLVMYAEMYDLPNRDEMLHFLGRSGQLSPDDCCGLINAIRQRREKNIRIKEASPAALLNDLRREGRLIRYSYKYGDKMLDPKAAHYFAVPYRCCHDWDGNMTINVVMLADGYLFPRKMETKKEGSRGTWKLRGIFSPFGMPISFSSFLEIAEKRDDGRNSKQSRLWQIAWLKTNGITEPSDMLMSALSEVDGLKKVRTDSLLRITKNPIWKIDKYVMKAGIIACALLGAFEDDAAVREKALSFLDSITEGFPTVIYMKHYDGDKEIKEIMGRYVKGGYLTYVPAGSTEDGNVFVPKYGSTEAREKIIKTSWLRGIFPREEDRKIWLKKLRLPSEFSKNELSVIDSPEVKKVAAAFLKFLYMPKDAADHFEVNREAFRGKKGARALAELKEILWARGDVNSDPMSFR